MSFRRTWDKEYYGQKAKERLEGGDSFVDEEEGPPKKKVASVPEEFRPAEEGAAGPMGSDRAFLKARDGKLELDKKAGQVEVINPLADANKAGFWCEVCSCLLKDSAAYLDHINGKKHQRALGFSMRVERAGVDDVQKKLAELKQKLHAPKANHADRPPAIIEYERKMKEQEDAKEALKQKRKEDEAEKKRLKLLEEQEEDEELEAETDPDMAAMMGFSGFGSKKKK